MATHRLFICIGFLFIGSCLIGGGTDSLMIGAGTFLIALILLTAIADATPKEPE